MRKMNRVLALACSMATCTSMFSTGLSPVFAAEETWVDASSLADNGTAEPVRDHVLPDANQFRYQKDELAAFCHFGPNTFNEIEWGEHYGSQTPAQIFRLNQDFDAENYVKTLHDSGFKKLIVTAKHHDGFCIWNSQWTDYDCAAAGYKNGNGDVLAEISAACTKYDLDMGLYLSPWDIHEPAYGYYDADGNALCGSNGEPKNGMTWAQVEELDAKDYNEYYNNQLQEILGNDKYGNNGHFVEVWMDGAKGGGSATQNYDFQRWFATIQANEGKAAGYDADCMLFGAESYTTVRWIGNENGTADEETWSKSIINREQNTINSNHVGSHTKGFENGNHWTVPEADCRITSGWFWGNSKKTPKTIEQLGNMYFASVGHGATLLLNIPPNNQGTLDDEIRDRTLELGQIVVDSFAHNIATDPGVVISASEVRGNDTAYSPAKLADADDETVWSTNDGTTTGKVRIKLPNVTSFDCISFEEAIQYGQRINNWSVRYKDDKGEWKEAGSGITVGPKRLIRLDTIKSDEVEITVSTPEGKTPVLSEVGLYRLAGDFQKPKVVPNGAELIDIKDSAFTFTGSWTNETGTQYLNGTNTYANPGASFTTTFTGTQISLFGTRDPNHGTADVYIDDVLVETIDMSQSPRKTGQVLFSSATLTQGSHTLRLVTKTRATGVEAAMVINNNNKGMVGIENAAYTMDEDSTMSVKIVRTGGTAPVTVTLSPNPGTAIQDDFDTENIQTIEFEEGEMEKTASVITTRNPNKTGPQFFTIELTCSDPDVILGWNDLARININDAEGDLYTASDPFEFPGDTETKTLEAERFTLKNTGENEQWPLQKSANSWASNGFFVNCCNSGDSIELPYTAEAGTYEVTLKYRSGSNANGFTITEQAGKITPVSVTAGADDSAAATHTKTFDLVITESGAGRLILAAGPSNAPQMDCFEIRVKPDPSILEEAITAADTAMASEDWPNYSAASKAAVTEALAAVNALKENPTTAGAIKEAKANLLAAIANLAVAVDSKLTVTCGEHGTSDRNGESTVSSDQTVTITFTPDDGYVLSSVKVNGNAQTITGNTLTLTSIEADTTVEAAFAFDHYTAANPFAFPVNGASATLEAEHSILNNTGTNEDWPLQKSSADWASNGKFINACDQNDSIDIHYNATLAGEYTVVLTYRSGSASNSIDISEPNGKVESISVAAGSDSVSSTKTKTFTLKVLEAGSGVLHIAAGTNKAPQMDKFDITAPAAPVELYTEALEMVINDTVLEDYSAFKESGALEEALRDARDTLANASTQAEIDEAATTLNQVWLNARLKVSQEKLDALVAAQPE